jgi:RNA polymerase sigma-70 factor (ECF subfamily)
MDEKQPDNEKLQMWWQLSLDNDTAAFGSIHAVLFDGLYNYAAKLLNDDALVDDAIQELFVKIWSKRNSIGRIEKIKPYFYTVLRRQVLNQLRDLKLKNLKISLLSQPDIEFSQEEILIQKEDMAGMKEKIASLLNTLPARQREILYLYYFDNMSLSQIAGVMGINHQSAMNLKQRALQKMRSENILSVFVLLCFLYRSGNF